MKRQVRVGGEWMSRIAPWGELSWSHDEKGCKDATWSAYFHPGRVHHPALVTGSLVEVLYGPQVVWAGVLDAPDWAEGTFSARGLSYDAESFQARDSLGAPTAVPSTAVDQAQARGWKVLGRSGVSTTTFVSSAGVNTVGALLDSSATEGGKRAFVRADRIVRAATDPTTPTYIIRPGVVELGNTATDYASRVWVTYLTTSGATAYTYREDAAAAAKFGAAEVELDLTDLGGMTLARAQGFGDGRLALGKARPGWANSVDVSRSQLLTVGGQPVDLALVESLQMVRIYVGYEDVAYLGGRTYLDAVIGSTEYTDGADTITLTPVGAVPTNQTEGISELYERAS